MKDTAFLLINHSYGTVKKSAFTAHFCYDKEKKTVLKAISFSLSINFRTSALFCHLALHRDAFLLILCALKGLTVDCFFRDTDCGL